MAVLQNQPETELPCSDAAEVDFTMNLPQVAPGNFGQLPSYIEHRPWPLPRRPWVMTMSWLDLLFAHYEVPANSLRADIPEGLELDTHEGRAWLGVVPFRMAHVGPRGLPNLPGISAFPELNLRTYVRCGDKAGVWFFSLDAANVWAVRGARWGFHLPYFDARMQCQRDEHSGMVSYHSTRTHRGQPPACFEGRYGPVGPEIAAPAGSLEQFLTERYCLYACDGRGRLWRGDIHHLPWSLRGAELESSRNSIADDLGFHLGDRTPDLLHFVERIDVVAWMLTPAG